MDQSLTAWMMSGGTRHETVEDRRQRQHRTALHEAAAARAMSQGASAWRTVVARWTGRQAATSPALTLDCCAA